MKKSNRYSGFWNSEAPLTSKRGRFILSNPVQSEILIDAVRKSRSDEKFHTKSEKIGFTKDIAIRIKAL